MSDVSTKRDLDREARHEAEYFDKLYESFDEEHGREKYIVPERIINKVVSPRMASIDAYERAYSLLGPLKGKLLLDYGAGDGWNTICFAKAGARVWAIDISQKGVDLVHKKSRANGVSHLVNAEVRNCYDTGFEDNAFDLVFGGGILHHLDVESAGREIQRILKPGGTAVFYEPIRESAIMDVVKAMVMRMTRTRPSDETEDEVPLTGKRIDVLRSYFCDVDYLYYEVLSSANALISSERIKKIILAIDYGMIRAIPGYKKLGRSVVIKLGNPVK